MTPPTEPTGLREAERADPFTPHDLGCRCYPHVSQRAAVEAATQAATAEYRESIRHASPGPEPVAGLEAHPDEPHEFRTVCQRCGENGYLHVAILTDLEVFKVEPRAALSEASEPRSCCDDVTPHYHGSRWVPAR